MKTASRAREVSILLLLQHLHLLVMTLPLLLLLLLLMLFLLLPLLLTLLVMHYRGQRRWSEAVLNQGQGALAAEQVSIIKLVWGIQGGTRAPRRAGVRWEGAPREGC